jgi:hypothetical protein
MRLIVVLLSALTCAVSAWMTLMYFVLRHPGYLGRAAVAGLIFAGALTMVGGRPLPMLRIPIALWAAALTGLGVWALISPGDDGWVIITAAVFIAEGVAVLWTAGPRIGAAVHGG